MKRLAVAAVACLAGCGAAGLDLLVVAPHSDDEAIGCATVMRRAIAEGRRVGVVVLSAGDGFPAAAAALAGKDVEKLTPDDFMALAGRRERHTREAMAKLGVDDLLFLGYPDGGLMKMYRATDETPYLQPHTRKTATYGGNSPYVRASLLDDLGRILRERRPKEIYVTGEADTHADHQAAFFYVRDAARAVGYRDVLWTFVVHGRPPDAAPGRRVTLTDVELRAKRSLLEGYQEGVSPVHDRLAETYARPEELFWGAAVEGR